MRWIQRWPSWVWALSGVFVVGLVVAGVLVWLDDDEGGTAASTTSATTDHPTTAATTTTTSTSPSPTTTTPPPTTARPSTAVPRTTTTQRPGPVPGVVVAVATAGGGSGEVQVDWNAVPAATGYRVLRTNADGGQARVMADFRITTGRTTAAPEVVNIWSAEYSYVPYRGPLTKPDRSPWFQYVDVGDGRRCYRVLAYNAAGNGPLSAITCSYPPTGPPPSSGAPSPSN